MTAAVGLAAGLGTSVFTQRRADAREDVRWRREREDRQEQWRREDSLRWVQDRKQAYARLVVALHESDTALASAARASEKAVKPNEQTELDLTEIKRAEKAAFEALAPVRFIAPKDTRSRARLTFERHRSSHRTWHGTFPVWALKQPNAGTKCLTARPSWTRPCRKTWG